ncbi:MAG: carbohydrate binding family 9 domain-containing protein [Acidobacteriota bacterium]|nr:carbohydrate binding family 9 domain-containing protein [Acidobacteriota bacterium]
MRDNRPRWQLDVKAFTVVMSASLLCAVHGFTEEAHIEAPLLAENPVIDGILDDAVWKTAEEVSDFVQFQPEFGVASPFKTVVLVGYTSETLYVAFQNFDPELSKIAAAVTARDGDLKRDDSVTVLIDTNHDRRTGYYFATNLLGVQTDGKIGDNGRVVDDRWDAAWECASSRTDDGWTTEFAIPLKMLRFAGGEDASWGINFFRRVPRRLETSLWSGPGESEWRVADFGVLAGLDVGQQGLQKFAVIPYGLISAERDGDVETKFGGDIRFRIKSDLSADVTINPDFALIEADVEKINLSRFELSLPEKRPFFLEGIEMYDQRIRQFYSRRIGDISAGGKIVGGLGGFDIAAIATRADLESEENGTPTTTEADYTVFRAQRGVFGPSTIGLLAANRRVDGEDQGSIGADMTLFFSETLGMTGQFLRSHGPMNDGSIGWFLRPAYDSATTHFHVRYTSLDEGLQDNVNAVGFLRDDDRREFDTNFKHQFWFQNSAFENLEGKVNYNRYWSQEGVLRSWELDADIELVMTSGWQFELRYQDEFELFEKEYRNSLTSFEFGYDNRQGRSAFLEFGTGTNYDSDLLLTTFKAEFRISSAWGFQYEVTWLELDPDPELESTWIHVLRSSYYFTNDLFVSLFLQTNSVISKENVQLLGVWRFKPPFGSLQLAYQRGTSEFGEPSEQGDTVFTKLSWVF